MSNVRKPVTAPPQQRLAGAFHDNFASGAIIVDARQKIRAITPGAEQLTGLVAAEILNCDSKILPAALRRVCERVFTTGKPVDDRQVLLAASDGKMNVRVTASPLQSGRAGTGVVMVLNNFISGREFEEKLSRLDRLANIGTLSAGMTHEIKNALVSVKTFIDLLLDRNQDTELADVVRREMRRINSIVSQTLKFAGPARPTFSTMRLHDVLDHSLRMVQPQIQAKLITLRRSFQAMPDIIQGDDYQIEQVFVNLFLNAIEAMNMSGSLTVSTEMISSPTAEETPGDPVTHIRVSITDTGVGIAAQNMARLFHPFFTTKENGTGLGLAIARRIVEEHSGKIHVQSEINKGTTFTVHFPAHTVVA